MPLPSGLQLQLTAQGQSYSDNQTMTAYADSSGNSRNATAASGAPKWRSALGPNGKAAVRFDGSSHFTLPNFLTGYTSGEIFILCKVDNDPAAAGGTSGGPVGAFGSDGLVNAYPYTDGNIYDDFGSTVRKSCGNPTPALTSWRLYNIRSQSGLWMAFIDGSPFYATTTNTVGWSTAPLVGKDTNYFLGYIADILFFDHVLTSTDRASVFTYFNDSSLWNLGLTDQTTPPDAYKAHWAETTNVTVDDATGKINKTSGAAGYNASGRVEQMFDGLHPVMLNAKFAAGTTMAFGVYAITTAYSQGAVTVASLLACWEITGGNGLVKESNTTKFTQASVATNDTFAIRLDPVNGTIWYYYNDTIVYVSAITPATVTAWRPVRFIATLSDTSAKLDPVDLYGTASEYYDPDTAANHVVLPFEDVDEVEYSLAAFVPVVQVGENMDGSSGPGMAAPFTEVSIG